MIEELALAIGLAIGLTHNNEKDGKHKLNESDLNVANCSRSIRQQLGKALLQKSE